MYSELNAYTKAIIAAIDANAGVIIDDHKSDTDNRRICHGVVEYQMQTDDCIKVFTCLVIPNAVFCLNKMYIDKDGIAHISTQSVGPVLDLMCSVQEAEQRIAALNEGFRTSNLAFMRHNRVMLPKYFHRKEVQAA